MSGTQSLVGVSGGAGQSFYRNLGETASQFFEMTRDSLPFLAHSHDNNTRMPFNMSTARCNTTSWTF